MIIECFGLPGAGKSTVVSRLVEHGGFIAVPARVSRKYAVAFILRKPLFVLEFVYIAGRESLQVRSFRLWRFKVAVLLNTIARYEYARVKSSGGLRVLLDEGMVQRLLSLYETKQVPEQYVRLLSRLPVTDMLVRVSYKGTQFTAGRVGTLRRQLSAAYEASWRDVMTHNHDAILKALHASNVLQCSGDVGDSGVENVKELVACVTSQ